VTKITHGGSDCNCVTGDNNSDNGGDVMVVGW
jgi:hypothetical protein